jgi:ABC-2 type transport system permease protein
MTGKINIIAGHEFKTLFKEKTFVLILIIFILMTLFSTYIGWSSRTTIENVYQETVKKLVSDGAVNQLSDPFIAIPILSIIKNMIVYVFLIGSLLAIIIGYNSFLRERQSGVSKIIFSKPLGRKDFVLGKIAGILFPLIIITAISFLISLASVSLITGKILPNPEILKLAAFYIISLVYMLIFAMSGLFFSIYLKSESMALLVPIIIWIFISFVLPELTSALNPNALLNPTNIQSSTPHGQFLLSLQGALKPFSVSETYKLISSNLLELDFASSSLGILKIFMNNLGSFIFMIFLLIFSVFGCFYAMIKFNACEEEIYE